MVEILAMPAAVLCDAGFQRASQALGHLLLGELSMRIASRQCALEHSLIVTAQSSVGLSARCAEKKHAKVVVQEK